MATKNFKLAAVAAGLVSAVGVLPLSAELPSMNDKDFLGYFVAVASKNYQFLIAADGKTTIKVLDSKGKPISSELSIPVIFTVEETLPDGKTISRKINPESLESSQPATLKPKNLSFKGKATGDLGFEVFVSEERGGILLGGHLLNPAEMKNPTRFSIEVKIPDSKPKLKADAEKDRKAAKEIERKIKDDKVQLALTDGKKVKITGDEAVEGSSKEVTGPGISAAAIEFSAFKEGKIHVTAAPNSSLRLSNSAKQPLTEGFSLFWSADPAKDPEGKARLAIEIK